MPVGDEEAHLQTAEQRTLLASLKQKMRGEGLRLQSVAMALGCSPATLSRQLNGKIGLRGPREIRIREFVGSSTKTEDLLWRLQGELASLGVNEMRAVLHFLQIMRDLKH